MCMCNFDLFDSNGLEVITRYVILVIFATVMD